MTDYIDTFERCFQGKTHSEVAALNPSSSWQRTMPTGSVAKGITVEAFVDGSRWLVRCPDLICGGAERVNFETGLFFCCECRNAAVANAYIRVNTPDDQKRQQIETVLLERPDWRFRAWNPDETVDELRLQNVVAAELQGE